MTFHSMNILCIQPEEEEEYSVRQGLKLTGLHKGQASHPYLMEQPCQLQTHSTSWCGLCSISWMYIHFIREYKCMSEVVKIAMLSQCLRVSEGYEECESERKLRFVNKH